MWVVFLLLLLLLTLPFSVHAEDLDELSANPFNLDSTCQSIRRRESPRPQQSHESLRPRPSD